jgi:hypothetical protein
VGDQRFAVGETRPSDVRGRRETPTPTNARSSSLSLYSRLPLFDGDVRSGFFEISAKGFGLGIR